VGRLLRGLFKLWLVAALAWAVAQLLARRLTEGDEDSDEFVIAALIGGEDRKSRASALSRARAVAACGGVTLDLRGATLDASGADLDLQAYMGGILVTVPSTWRVEVTADAKAGGVDTHLPPPETIADDAPLLRVNATARMGGVLVTTKPTPRRHG
jgi:hypothetical protein